MHLSCLAVKHRDVSHVAKTYRTSRVSHRGRTRTKCDHGDGVLGHGEPPRSALPVSKDPKNHTFWPKLLQYWYRARWWVYGGLAGAFVVMLYAVFSPAMSPAAMAPHVASVTTTASMTVATSPSEQISRWLLYKMQRVCHPCPCAF